MPWRWHLEHCSWKTTLPRAESPPSLSSGASRSITFWRSGSGRPPPRSSSRLARAAIFGVGMGRQGLASGRAPARRVCAGSCSRASTRAGLQSVRPSMILRARDRSRGRSFGSVSASACPTPGALLGATASSRPAASSGEPSAADQIPATAARRTRRPARSSTSCRAASMRARLGELLVPRPSPAATRRSRRPGRSRAWLPQRPASRTSCAARGGGQLDRQLLEGLRRPCRAGPAGPWASRGPARGGSTSLTAGSPPGSAARSARRCVGRAAARPVLGHAARRSRAARGRRRLLAAGGEQPSRTPRRSGPRRPWPRRPATVVAVTSSAAKRRPRRPRPPRRRGLIGQAQKRRQANLGIRVAQQAGRDRSRRPIAASRGKTWTALRRTPADGCLSAAPRPPASAAGFEPIRRPGRAASRAAWIAPTFRPIASTDASRSQLDQSRARRRSCPRSTSSRWACSRQS